MERKVASISDIDGNIKVTFNDTEYCIFHKFGKDILTTTSPGVLKKTLVNLKKDVKDTNFSVEELKRLWLFSRKPPSLGSLERGGIGKIKLIIN